MTLVIFYRPINCEYISLTGIQLLSEWLDGDTSDSTAGWHKFETSENH